MKSQEVGLASSFDFFLTVFFIALNESEDPSLSRFNVGGKFHWIEAAAGGATWLTWLTWRLRALRGLRVCLRSQPRVLLTSSIIALLAARLLLG